MRVWLSLGCALLLAGCGQQNEPVQVAQTPAADAPQKLDPSGSWRAVLGSPGGELPFTLVISADGDGFRGHVLNGPEEVPFSDVLVDQNKIELAFSWYDAEIKAHLSDDGSVMRGEWRKTAAEGNSRLRFTATKGLSQRFLPAMNRENGSSVTDVSGIWSTVFTDEDGQEVAQGEFVQNGQQLDGTFLTPTGDYRYLAGSYEDGLLRLSAFDGAHAFLFTAEARADGSMKGDFWSRDTYHATWEAQLAEQGEAILPDAWELVQLTGDDKQIAFAFEDINGQMVSLSDERFAGKPVVINLFGSWCPNCNDEAPLMAQWYRDYRDQGLEMIGLAFEFTGDVERDREMVRRFGERHNTEYPLLVAGLSDKDSAAESLGFLDKVVAYPTTLFLNSNHEVVGIHSGFSGPGTGDHYEELVAELQQKIESLL